MGLFDKIKGAVENTAGNFKEGYDEAAAMDLYELCDELKELGMLDPKMLSYRTALSEKCKVLSDDEIEEFYKFVKKAGSLLKQHPAQKVVEDVLVTRKLYIRQDDGTVVKNSAAKWFK
ncbi:MAG: hypothetical protein IJ443_09155 [Firmicutes bacterium]|nr:hypothetical protein [Bacillota bacterium]